MCRRLELCELVLIDWIDLTDHAERFAVEYIYMMDGVGPLDELAYHLVCDLLGS